MLQQSARSADFTLRGRLHYNAGHAYQRDRGIDLMKFFRLLIPSVVAVVVASSAHAEEAGADCVIAADRGGEYGDLSGIRALIPADSGPDGRIAYRCGDGAVSGLNVRLAPGQAAEARLLLARRPGDDDLEPGFSEGLPASWAALRATVVGGDALLVVLSISVPETASPGTVHSDRLVLSGQHRAGIPLTLRVIESEPLFRDGFGVDPVIGQFSLAP